MLTAVKLGRRLTIVVILGLVAIASFFIINSYRTSRMQLEQSVLSRLQAIANTTALQIDGELHEQIVRKYTQKDQLKKPLEDVITTPVFKLLKEVKLKNNLKTDIYTLFIEQEGSHKDVYMGIMSGDIQYFRHNYFSHPKELLLYFDKGYTLPSYEDEHGVWLSAFSPIKNAKGATVAVVQVDEQFDVFLGTLKNIVINSILISLFIIVVIAVVMLYLISGIVKVDKEKTERLERAYQVMEVQNKKISDSINYAQRIQNAIVAKESDLHKYFPESFMYYNAKDVVSGDFPWLMEKDGVVYIAVVDCTGHGVPGAMLSFIGHFLLDEINNHLGHLSPNEILDRLHDGVVKTLKQEDGSESSHDGMDIALCKIDKKANTLEYSGAHRPLLLVKDGKLEEIKGTRKSIGGTQYKKTNRVFENNVIELEEGNAFYFYSDGLVDQMGGEQGNKKLGSRRVREMLSEANHADIKEVSSQIIDTFVKWQGDVQQLDDVLLIGIKV